MKPVTGSAPGKVVLSGEYAVLAGAPALSMAVNRRAVTRIEPSPGRTGRLCTPGFAEGQWRFDATAAGTIDWIDEPPAGAASLVGAAFRELGGDLPPVSISIDTRAFRDPGSRVKLGLGSSAAAMTSLVAALAALAGRDAEVALLAREAHRRLQGGGSGVDVATCASGGLIEFRVGERGVSRRTWPPGLAFAIFWSGKPSDTARMIASLDGACWTSASGQALIAAAGDVAANWPAADVPVVLASVARYADRLHRFDIDRGLGIFDAGHDALHALAPGHGLVYKPCGAGGGDIGIALAADDAAIPGFARLAEEHGFRMLRLTTDPAGAECRYERSP